MNPKHPAWFALPILGIVLGLFFRLSEDFRLPSPETETIETRDLVLPDGTSLRFLRGPGMRVFISKQEVPVGELHDREEKPLTHSQAVAFCTSLSKLTRTSLRLPTEAEWRRAASAGVPSAQYPWGFDSENRPESLHFNLESPPDSAGPALGYGFQDLAGGRWEWTAEGTLLGSAWSEADPETLRIASTWIPPQGYRGKDVGLRLVWE